MLAPCDFGQARRIELELALAGQPARVVGRRGATWGAVLSEVPARGVLGVLSASLGAALGVPVVLQRRGRHLVVWASTEGRS